MDQVTDINLWIKLRLNLTIYPLHFSKGTLLITFEKACKRKGGYMRQMFNITAVFEALKFYESYCPYIQQRQKELFLRTEVAFVDVVFPNIEI